MEVEEEGRINIEFDYKVERRRHGRASPTSKSIDVVRVAKGNFRKLRSKQPRSRDRRRCDHDVVDLHMTHVSRCSTYSSLDAALHQINVGDP